MEGWERYEKGEVIDPKKPVVFVHVEGEESREYGSKYNEAEVEACSEIVSMLLGCGVREDAIGIITPYKAPEEGPDLQAS